MGKRVKLEEPIYDKINEVKPISLRIKVPEENQP